MKKLILTTICLPLFVIGLFAQNSGITIGDSNETIDGTIKYNNATGFEGLHLGNWQPFTGTNTATSPWLTNGAFLYYNAGNVGIGTNTPAYKLDINGAVGTGAIFTSAGRMELGGNGTGDRASYMDFHASDNQPDYSARINRLAGENGALIINNLGTGAIKFYSDIGLTTMSILSSGEVGIGTQNPAYKLDVNGAVGTGAIFTTEGRVEIGKDGAGDRPAYIDFHASDVETDWTSRIYRSVGENGNFTISNKGTGIFRIENQNFGHMVFETNDVERIRIETSGKVGIGTNAPTAKLHVNGALRSNTVNIDPEDSTIEGGEIILRGAGTNNDYRIDNYDGSLRFFQPFQVAMTIDANANVAIGNVDVVGAYKLYVDEGILTERVKIATMGTAEWADYVFEEDYELKSLPEIKQFVQKNKHLPNIPSAQEIEDKGYELQKMDAKLLEKIEELYLLTIQLNEEKQQIEATNKKLQQENELLKTTQQSILERLSKLEKTQK